ncbi:MAG: tetratricopeptide repeat protein, partial [Acidobacteria bacterium]|nr:tetratricopeptide repeat protein [Acidobacteriota bacterium]
MAAFKKTGKADMALAVFDRIKEMEPKDAEGWVALGKAFLDGDEKNKALFAFKNAEKLAKAKYGVLEEISFALYNAHHFTSALEFNKRAKEENPSEKQSYNIAGLIHRAMGNHRLAIVEYQRSIQIDPDDAALYYNVGVAFIKS